MDRFIEIVSTERIIDTLTGKEYYGLVDDEIIDLLNDLHRENNELREMIYRLKSYFANVLPNYSEEHIDKIMKRNVRMR